MNCGGNCGQRCCGGQSPAFDTTTGIVSPLNDDGTREFEQYELAEDGDYGIRTLGMGGGGGDAPLYASMQNGQVNISHTPPAASTPGLSGLAVFGLVAGAILLLGGKR